MTTTNGEDDIYDVLNKQSFEAFCEGEKKQVVRYQIKLVPDSAPNDDGEWIDVPTKPKGKWRDYEAQYAAHIPNGYHMVAIQMVT